MFHHSRKVFIILRQQFLKQKLKPDAFSTLINKQRSIAGGLDIYDSEREKTFVN
jgi:hypothetical protein